MLINALGGEDDTDQGFVTRIHIWKNYSDFSFWFQCLVPKFSVTLFPLEN